ncbi:MAG: SDR family oxidoreductase [Nitrospirae bacterium]|nr:SDR family oxidoreductase [Nitrospirota bacterium]
MRTIGQLADLRGRIALVTGGAGRIGRVVCGTLLEMGASLGVLDANKAGTLKLLEELPSSKGRTVVPLVCDLSNEKATRGAVRSAVRRLGGLDIVVHCAAWVGTTRSKGWAVPFRNQTVSAWDAAMRVNMTAPFVMVQEAKEALARSGHASVIFLASTYGLVGPDPRLYRSTSLANPAAYGASKGGLLQLTRYLATVLAPRIRVNAISPGGLEREGLGKFKRRYVDRTPLARMATDEDIKGALAFLASDLSGYVTGHNLVVDGGWTTW